MTDSSRNPAEPPPSYEEVQAMSGGVPYPMYPQNQGFKYDGYGAPPYPGQPGVGQIPYPQQPSVPYPQQGDPYTYPYGAPGQPPPPPPGSAAYTPQEGVVVNGRNTILGMNDLQRRRRIFLFIFVFVAVALFIYFLFRVIM